MAKCDALFGHSWTMRNYQDPKRAAKGYITEKCSNLCKDGTPCDATRERKGTGAVYRTTVTKKGQIIKEPKREVNPWAGGKLESKRPVKKAAKKSGGEVTSSENKDGCPLALLVIPFIIPKAIYRYYKMGQVSRKNAWRKSKEI